MNKKLHLNRVTQLRVVGGSLSLLAAVVAAVALVPLASAQQVLQTDPPVTLSTPQGLDVMPDLSHDPFLDTIDRGGARGTTIAGGGASVGTPDVSYNQANPVDGSIGGNPMQVGSTVNQAGHGARHGAQSDPLSDLRLIGTVSGDPPLGIFQFADGHQAVYALGDLIMGLRIAGMDAHGVRLSNGRMLTLTRAVFTVPAAGSPMNALPNPMNTANPVLPNGQRLGVPTDGNSPADTGGGLSPASIAPGGGNGTPVLAPAGGPDAENAGHMPLSPALPFLPGMQTKSGGSK